MPVNATFATYSDWSYASAGAVYLLAMLFHAVELAAGRPRRATQRIRQAAAELVTAGGGGAVHASPVSEPVAVAEKSLPERFGRMAVALTVLGALLHAASLVLRGFAVGRVPWGNMYEFGSAICFTAVLVWLVVLHRNSVRQVGAYVLLPVIVLMFLCGTVLYVQAAPLQPALQSYWITIHVTAAIISTGVFLVAGVSSALYILRRRHEADSSVSNRRRRLAAFAARLPSADTLDRLAYRTTVFVFPVWTFAIIAGAIWAEAAWGRYWGWDPKEATAFVAWVVYASYLHARATAGWRGVKAAWINVAGFAIMIFNLFFINLVTSGLHSYAGL
jgi:cytochrome c-type biogenesis protein CcsB